MPVQWQAGHRRLQLEVSLRSAPRTRSIPASVLVFLGVEGLRRPQTYHNLPSRCIAFGSWARGGLHPGVVVVPVLRLDYPIPSTNTGMSIKGQSGFRQRQVGLPARATIQANVASQDGPREFAVARPKGDGQRTGRSLDAVWLRIQPFVGHCRIRHSRPWRIQYDQTSGWNLLTEIARELYD